MIVGACFEESQGQQGHRITQRYMPRLFPAPIQPEASVAACPQACTWLCEG